MNPNAKNIVKNLRGCVFNIGQACDECAATGDLTCGCREELMLIVADLIEQLQQELIDERYRHDRLQDFCVAQGEGLSKLKAQQKWIPVTERLPEADGKYIVCTAKNSVYCTRWHKDYFGTDSYTHITHWMHLPEAPKEE